MPIERSPIPLTPSREPNLQAGFMRVLDFLQQLDPVTQKTVLVSNADIQVVPANTSRKRIMLRNYASTSSAIIFIHYGSTPATITNSFPLMPGEVFELPPNTIYKGEIRAIATSSNRELYVEEWQ